jgi:hypothetical protein
VSRLVLIIVLLLVIGGCGNRYYHDFADVYEPVRLHLGEANDAIGARAMALAGAGRAVADSPAAVVQNPAGLAELKNVSFEGGFGYENRALRWQADSSYPIAEASTNSFNGLYGAFSLPVVRDRLYLGVAHWVPYDLKLTAGDTSNGAYVESDGAVRSVTPGFAVAFGPAALGFSTDILWGGQDFDTTAPVGSFDVGFFGYDLRVGFRYKKRYNRSWGFALGAVVRRGARLSVSNGVSYSLGFGPQIGVAGSLLYKRLSFNGDYVYNFVERSASDDSVRDYALERITRDAPYYMVGFEYALNRGVVRGGFAVKPALYRDASRGAVDGRFYSVGGGWKTFGGRGFIDVALTYGRRGSINKNRFATGYIDLFLTVRYDL